MPAQDENVHLPALHRIVKTNYHLVITGLVRPRGSDQGEEARAAGRRDRGQLHHVALGFGWWREVCSCEKYNRVMSTFENRFDEASQVFHMRYKGAVPIPSAHLL